MEQGTRDKKGEKFIGVVGYHDSLARRPGVVCVFKK